MTIFEEPLVHCLLLSAAIFGLYAALEDSPPPKAENAIFISKNIARRLVVEFQATWLNPPIEIELTAWR